MAQSRKVSQRRQARLGMERLEDRTNPAALPPGFSEAIVADTLSGATAMEFAPNGDLWVLEQAGAVKRFRPGNTSADLVGNLTNVGLRSEGERGVLGITFDPNYATNKWVYLYYTSSDAPNPHNRISRFTVNDTNPADYSFVDTTANTAVYDETEILNLDALSSATNHNGGAIHFGPDGKLYAAVGENANGANSQSLSNRLGKILRINADGSIPTDNPTSFAGVSGTTSGANRAIWAVGLRNPYTFTFQPGTTTMFINDVGQNTWEEVNIGGAGRNYGWPTTEGDFTQSSFPNFTRPLYAYRHGTAAFQGFAITGGAFYNPSTSQFPSSYSGDYFFGDYVNDWINVMNADGSGVSQFATGAPGVVDLRVTNDGSLYYLARDAGRVYRVNYSANQAPTVTQQPQSATATAGANATFTVTATGTPTPTYQWQRLNGSTWGNLSNGSGVSGAATATLTLTAVDAADAGQYRVVVSNSAGNVTSNAATLTVTAAGITIVDDGDAGFSAGAGWNFDPDPQGLPYYQVDHYYVHGTAGAQPTTWTASGLAAGTYRVSAQWVGGDTNRATNAAYAVRSGAGATLATAVVNQEQNPNDFQDAGVWWEDLGTVTLSSSGSLAVSLSGQANEYLIADAVRFELVSPPPPPPPPGAVTIVDDGDAGFSAGAGWNFDPDPQGLPYYQVDHYYVHGTAGAQPTTWTASGLAAGTYRVSAQWVGGDTNRATNAAYAVRTGAGATLATAVVNQEQNPNDFQDAGVWWEDLGTVTLSSSGSLVVSLSGQANEYLIADAVRFELVSPPPPPPPPGAVTIVDDGDAGFSAGAGWNFDPDPQGLPYYQVDHYYVHGTTGAQPTTWTTSAAAGTYRVSAHWVGGDTNRATNAAYAVRTGAGATLATAVVNQEQNPNDFQDAGVWWEDLGTVTLSSSGSLVVSLSGQANEYLIADAVRFERIA